VINVLERAGRNLTLDRFIASLESINKWKDIFWSAPLNMTPANHHASNQSFLWVGNNKRWSPSKRNH
jgi:hypothetical protein